MEPKKDDAQIVKEAKECFDNMPMSKGLYPSDQKPFLIAYIEGYKAAIKEMEAIKVPTLDRQ